MHVFFCFLILEIILTYDVYQETFRIELIGTHLSHARLRMNYEPSEEFFI